jgi:hypothetical protein
MRWVITVLAIAVVLIGRACPVLAEHLTLVPPTTDGSAPHLASDPSPTVDVGVTLGRDSFRLGARLFGALGVYGAWLNGQARPDGFSLDGRLQHPDRAFTFKLNAEIDAWARRAFDALIAP